MSAVNEALVRYIGRLEEENRALTRRVQELTPNETPAIGIRKALHDASMLVGAKITYKLTDSDADAVAWIKEIAEMAQRLWRREHDHLPHVPSSIKN